MKMRHMLVVSAFLASTLAAAGCSGANSFQSLNDTFKTVKTASAGLKNANIAGAAIATNLAAVELIGAFSNNASGVISAGGGNVISAGGGNYALLATDSGEDDLKSDRKDKNGNPIVTAHYAFTRTTGTDGSLHYELKSFDGKASGFNIKATGSFDFVPSSSGKYVLQGAESSSSIPATVKATLMGAITTDNLNLTLDQLSFTAKNPLPDNMDDLGVVKMSNNTDKTGLDLHVSVVNKVIAIKGQITQDGKPTYNIEQDENSQQPKLTPVTSDSK